MVRRILNKGRICSIILITLIISSISLSLLVSPTNNKNGQVQLDIGKTDEKVEDDIIKASNGDVSYDSFYQNASIIRRDFESVFFEVNVSDIEYANETHLEITFTNNSIKQFNMTYVLGTIMNFTYEYRPRGDAPLGFQRVRFLIYNESKELINTEASYHTNFTIRSTSMVGFNSSEYYRNEEVLADIAIDESEKYDWKITVVNTTDKFQQDIIETFPNNPFQISFTIDDRFDKFGTNQFDYFVAVNMTEDDGFLWDTWNIDYFGFLINNFDPLISNIKLTPSSVFRGQFCAITLNASDIESDINEVSMVITDTLGQTVPVINPLHNSQGNIFEGNFTIDANRPKGNYDIEFTATDFNGGESIQNTAVLIKNNPPKIDGYTINDIDTNERISVPYGDDLNFDFDVSDFEGISYITVKLIMEDYAGEKVDEYKASVAYEDGTELTIRTEDLTAGTWTVYVSVTDTDGETTDLGDDFNTGPKQITVVPDLLSDLLPWIMLIVGSIIGIIAGIGLGYHAAKSKYAKYKTAEEKIPIKKKAKPVKKPIKEKPISVGQKAVEKETKEVPEKEEPKKPAPKRKIKRKL